MKEKKGPIKEIGQIEDRDGSIERIPEQNYKIISSIETKEFHIK